MTHITSIQTGDDYIFLGLTGSSTPATGPDIKIISIYSISVTGELAFRIDTPDAPGDHLYSISYADAVLMIEEGIWGPYLSK